MSIDTDATRTRVIALPGSTGVDIALGLLAEIERLRKELDYLNNQRRLDNGDLARAYDEGRDNERAATVAWLREQVSSVTLYRVDDVSVDAASAGVAMLLTHVANIIESGEHRTQEGP